MPFLGFSRSSSLLVVIALTACNGATEVDLGSPTPAPTGNAPATPSTGTPPVTPPTTATQPAVETVISGQELPSHVAVGGSRVFFSPSTGYRNDVYRFDVAAKRRAQLGIDNAQALYVADGAGFFVVDDLGIAGSGLDGCSLEECDGFYPQLRAPTSGIVKAIALDASHVYWVSEAGTSYALYRAQRTLGEKYQTAIGSAPETVATWNNRRVTDLFIVDGAVYAGGDRDLMVIDASTRALQNVTSEGPVGPFAADLDSVYWVDGTGVQRRKRVGGTRETILELPAYVTSCRFAAFGRGGVYFFSSSTSAIEPTGKLTRVDVETKVVTEIVSDIGGTPYGALSDGYFYWSNPRAGTILRTRDE